VDRHGTREHKPRHLAMPHLQLEDVKFGTSCSHLPLYRARTRESVHVLHTRLGTRRKMMAMGAPHKDATEHGRVRLVCGTVQAPSFWGNVLLFSLLFTSTSDVVLHIPATLSPPFLFNLPRHGEEERPVSPPPPPRSIATTRHRKKSDKESRLARFHSAAARRPLSLSTRDATLDGGGGGLTLHIIRPSCSSLGGHHDITRRDIGG
jgi:hypothetical protein